MLLLDVLLCRNNSVAMGASFSAPEYSLKVADVSKIRTLNAIARNTLWPGGDVQTDSHDKSVKEIPQSWSQVILLIFPRRHFGRRLCFSRYCWLKLLELRDSISTFWDIPAQRISEHRVLRIRAFISVEHWLWEILFHFPELQNLLTSPICGHFPHQRSCQCGSHLHCDTQCQKYCDLMT